MVERSLIASTLGSLPVQLDPTGRDYESLRTLAIELISRITPEWTDFSEADPGVAILEAMAMIGGVQSYNTDRAQNEGYLLTAQLRRSVVQLLRLIAYELSPSSAASVPLVVEVSQTLTLPALYAVQNDATAFTPSLTFELLQAVSLTAVGFWTTSALAPDLAVLVSPTPVFVDDNLVVVHGTSVLGETVGTSDGTPTQVFDLAESPLALNPDGTSPLAVRVSAVQWTQVPSFLNTESTDEVYKVEIAADDTISIIFGDGVNGKVPPAAAVIDVDYRVGGGSVGNNVGVQTLTTQVVPVTGVVQVYNPVQPSGGSARETIEHAKQFGPLSLRALDRAVTLEDYETLAQTVPGGGIAAAKASHTTSPFEVVVYIAAAGSNPVPSGRWFPELDSGTGLIGAVGRHLSTKKAVPTRLLVEGPTVVRPYMQGEVFVKPNFLRADVERDVNLALATYFVEKQATFGVGIPLSDVIRVIDRTRGVSFVNMESFRRFPATRFVSGNEDAFLAAGVTISDFGPLTVFDRYTIQWLNSGSFELVGEQTGIVRSRLGVPLQFVVSTTHEINHFPINPSDIQPVRQPQFSIEIVLGAPTPVRGERWTFAVDNSLGNLAISPFEMVIPTLDEAGLIDAGEFALRFGGGIG